MKRSSCKGADAIASPGLQLMDDRFRRCHRQGQLLDDPLGLLGNLESRLVTVYPSFRPRNNFTDGFSPRSAGFLSTAPSVFNMLSVVAFGRESRGSLADFNAFARANASLLGFGLNEFMVVYQIFVFPARQYKRGFTGFCVRTPAI